MDQYNVLVDFCMHTLTLLDIGALTRLNIIQAFKDKDKAILHEVRRARNLETDEDLNTFVYELRKKDFKLRLEMNKALRELPEVDRICIMNDDIARRDFVKKYVEEIEGDIKNDKLFQCDKHLHGCQHGS